jgi:hypothetical protein
VSSSVIYANQGEEVATTFGVFDEDGVVEDLTGMTITGEIWWRNEYRIELTVENGGIVIDDPDPPQAEDGDEQTPHGVILLTEEITAQIPLGQISYLKLILVTSADETFIAGPYYINVRLPARTVAEAS